MAAERRDECLAAAASLRVRAREGLRRTALARPGQGGAGVLEKARSTLRAACLRIPGFTGEFYSLRRLCSVSVSTGALGMRPQQTDKPHTASRLRGE